MPPRLQKVLDLLDEPMTCKEIAKAAGLRQSVALSIVLALLERGLVGSTVVSLSTHYFRTCPKPEPEITETTVQRAIKAAHPLHHVWRSA